MGSANAVHMVPGASWAALGRTAELTLERYSPTSLLVPGPVPIAKILQVDLGRDNRASIDITERSIMGVEGVTVIENGRVVVRFSLETWDGVENGDGRARFTAAHELGHVVLHADYLRNQMLVRGGSAGMKRSKENVPAYCDPEKQANVFASRLLMPTAPFREAALQLRNLRALARLFQVSLEAARIRVRDLGLESIVLMT